MQKTYSQTPSPTTNIQKNPGLNIEIFHPKKYTLRRWGLISLGGVILLGTTISSVLIILDIYTAIQRHGRAVILNSIVPLLPLLLIGLPLGIALIFWTKNHWNDRLILQEDDMIQQIGKKHRVWSYKETQRMDTTITNINFGGSIVATKVKLFLKGENKKQWVIKNCFENMSDLVDGIRSRILPELYKKSVQKLAQGEHIIFTSNLVAEKKGLKVKEDLISWHDIANPVYKNNRLLLSLENDQEIFYKTKVNKIRNLDLLICLIDNPPVFDN